MGKKKVIKNQREEAEDILVTDNNDSEAIKISSKKKGKNKKKDDLDDIANELEEMALEQTTDEKNANGPAVKPNNAQKKKDASSEDDNEQEEKVLIVKSKFNAFAAIDNDMMVDIDNDDDNDSSSEMEPKSAKPVPAAKQNKAKQSQNKKFVPDPDDFGEFEEDTLNKPEMTKVKNTKKKSRKNRQEDIEEDLDQLLAEMRRADGIEDEQLFEPVSHTDGAAEVQTSDVNKIKRRRKRKGKGEDDEGTAELVANDSEKIATEADSLSGEKSLQENDEISALNQAEKSSDASVPGSGLSKRQLKKMAEEERKKKKQEEEERKKIEEEDKRRAKKGLPSMKALAAMKEIQQKLKDEEEKRRRAAEEQQRLDEERIRLEEERKRLDQERKERKKQKEREKKERLKAEGKLLTAKQKADQRRAQELLEHLKAQGVHIPDKTSEKATARLGSKNYAKKKQPQPVQRKTSVNNESEQTVPQNLEEKEREAVPEDDGVKESWDMSSGDEEDEEETTEEASCAKSHLSAQVDAGKDEDDAGDESDSYSSSEVEDNEDKTIREKVISRITKRKETNEKNRSLDKLRAPVVCVLGHVDHGKTKILDKLRRTNVQEGEVGGITQQIGATNVPAEAIAAQTRMVRDFAVSSLKFPGLLIIDTPGHESFSNLRNRGSSLCDLAILVVDITQGLEPQTIESIELLKKRKTPFVVALNKVDRIFQWESNMHKDIREVVKVQKETAQLDFEKRCTEIILSLNEQGLNAALFYENPDPRLYVSLVPTSAITGDGMGNLIAIICDLCQNKLASQLRFSEELQCTVLEVKTIQGYGTTIDVILVNGRLREGDTIVLAGTESPIVTQIRSLLLPKPLKEIRVKGAYDELKEVSAAQGVKLAAKNLEKAIAGLSLLVVQNEDEIDILKELVDRNFKQAMRSIKVKEIGVYVQASTLGALEALLEFFKSKSIPYSGIRVGPVVKRDVMKASAMLEHDPKYAVILAFDVKVDRDAQELADKEGVRIFMEETIYHLGDRYVEYLEEYKRKQQEENKNVAIFPCKLKIIPEAVFNKRQPIVLGVNVDAGVLRTGTLLCVPTKEFVEIGIVTSMEFDHKPVDIAKKGVDVCIKIDPTPGSTPKLFGRHFDASDELVSKISRESINACKEFFREDLSKADWKLMAELKGLFQIL